ncbi:MAG TPA: ParB/RepB/Spo0J family partition protein [Zoogloea sp.]|nr:ParB/RepB/Spo0J family partition protein [Zoogloea sp.]
MVKKAALKTAGISMAGFQPRAKVFDGQTPEPTAATPDATREHGRPFTGVGSVMAAITREAEISQELIGAQAKLQQATVKLAEYEGADLVRALDPKAVRRSQWANRAEAEFSTPEFLLLKDEIANAGGNVQPIKVRALEGAPTVFDGQTPTHEIVFGHRRHQACLELGLAVNAIVVERMDDKSMFEAMDRENRGRKNLSAWEQGRMYDQAIKQGLYPSLRRLSESLGVNLSDASRAVHLAKLPKEVIAAFNSPLDLQVRWAKPLVDALQRDPDGVLKRARKCALQAAPRGPAEVFAQLVGLESKPALQDVVIANGKQRLAILRLASNGKATIEFEAGVLTDDRRGLLAQVLKDFLLGSKPN